MSRKTIFFKPKYKKIADLIRIDTPKNAKEGLKELYGEFKKLKTKKAMLRRIRSITLAINRINAMLKKKSLSAKERKELKEVKKIFVDYKQKMRRYYAKKK